MRLLRAILLGILMWVLIFALWIIMMFVPGVRDSLNVQWLIHFIMLIPISVLCARIYYLKKDRLSGFFLGLMFFVVLLILDLIITAPFFTGMVFFSSILLWVGIIEMVIVVWITEVLSH